MSFENRFSNSAEALTSIAIDSNHLYVASSDGNVSIWKKQGFSFERRLSEAVSAVNSIAVDESFLFAGLQDGRVLVYSLEDFSLHSVIAKSFNSVKQVFSNPTAGYVAVAAADSGVFFFSWPEFFETFDSSAGTLM